MSKQNVITLVIMLIICSSGCHPNINRDEVVGVYAVKYPYGTEQLKLLQDGNYEQMFALDGQTMKLINNGKWELRLLDGLQLILNDPVIVDDGFGRLAKSLEKKESSIWPLYIKKSITGKISFPINEDQGFVFKKVQ